MQRAPHAPIGVADPGRFAASARRLCCFRGVADWLAAMGRSDSRWAPGYCTEMQDECYRVAFGIRCPGAPTGVADRPILGGYVASGRIELASTSDGERLDSKHAPRHAAQKCKIEEDE